MAAPVSTPAQHRECILVLLPPRAPCEPGSVLWAVGVWGSEARMGQVCPSLTGLRVIHNTGRKCQIPDVRRPWGVCWAGAPCAQGRPRGEWGCQEKDLFIRERSCLRLDVPTPPFPPPHPHPAPFLLFLSLLLIPHRPSPP